MERGGQNQSFPMSQFSSRDEAARVCSGTRSKLLLSRLTVTCSVASSDFTVPSYSSSCIAGPLFRLSDL